MQSNLYDIIKAVSWFSGGDEPKWFHNNVLLNEVEIEFGGFDTASSTKFLVIMYGSILNPYKNCTIKVQEIKLLKFNKIRIIGLRLVNLRIKETLEKFYIHKKFDEIHNRKWWLFHTLKVTSDNNTLHRCDDAIKYLEINKKLRKLRKDRDNQMGIHPKDYNFFMSFLPGNLHLTKYYYLSSPSHLIQKVCYINSEIDKMWKLVKLVYKYQTRHFMTDEDIKYRYNQILIVDKFLDRESPYQLLFDGIKIL